MRFKIFIVDFETPRWLRRTLSYVVPASIVLGIGSVVFATPPQQFTSGATLKAADLNSLSVVKNAGVSYSVGATTYCGTSTTATTGAISSSGRTGYAGAKAMCEASTQCGMSATAHMCTSDELTRSLQLGMALPNAWYSSGFTSQRGTPISSDCVGWSSTQSSDTGPAWSVGPPLQPSVAGCNFSLPVMCCD